MEQWVLPVEHSEKLPTLTAMLWECRSQVRAALQQASTGADRN